MNAERKKYLLMGMWIYENAWPVISFLEVTSLREVMPLVTLTQRVLNTCYHVHGPQNSSSGHPEMSKANLKN